MCPQPPNLIQAGARMLNKLKNFVRSDRGSTAIEYALIASLIALAVVAGLTLIGSSLNGVFVATAAGFD